MRIDWCEPRVRNHGIRVKVVRELVVLLLRVPQRHVLRAVLNAVRWVLLVLFLDDDVNSRLSEPSLDAQVLGNALVLVVARLHCQVSKSLQLEWA